MIHALHQLQNVFVETTLRMKADAFGETCSFTGYVFFSYIVNRHKSTLRRFCGLEPKQLERYSHPKKSKEGLIGILKDRRTSVEDIQKYNIPVELDVDSICCHAQSYDDVKIAACKSSSGEIKELIFCQNDHCFYVTVNGKERLRSDIQETAYRFFVGTKP